MITYIVAIYFIGKGLLNLTLAITPWQKSGRGLWMPPGFFHAAPP